MKLLETLGLSRPKQPERAPGVRARRAPAPTLPPEHLRVAWQCISLLLEHPTERLVSQLPLIAEAVTILPETVRAPLERLVAHLGASDLITLQRDYVATFDVTRKCALHLTFYAFGDTRKRGIALVQFKQAYRRGGLEVSEDELPDHLCVLLEFGSAGDVDIAWKLLNDHRAGIEMLQLALEQRTCPWSDAVSALRATLPALNGTQAEAVARLLEEGPPGEEVGMDAYALDPRLNPHPSADSGFEFEFDGMTGPRDLDALAHTSPATRSASGCSTTGFERGLP